jgi:hypothetical protein
MSPFPSVINSVLYYIFSSGQLLSNHCGLILFVPFCLIGSSCSALIGDIPMYGIYLFHGTHALTCTITGLSNLNKDGLKVFEYPKISFDKNLAFSFETLVQLA